MKWLLLLPVGLMVAVLLYGLYLPEKHQAQVSRHVHARAEVVFATITQVSDYPLWRPSLHACERLDARGTREIWAETDRDGETIEYATEIIAAPKQLVRRIVSPDLPYGGTWTFELEPDAQGTQIRITESGEIRSAFWRVLARWVFGYERSMTVYLDDLQRRVEQVPVP